MLRRENNKALLGLKQTIACVVKVIARRLGLSGDLEKCKLKIDINVAPRWCAPSAVAAASLCLRRRAVGMQLDYDVQLSSGWRFKACNLLNKARTKVGFFSFLNIVGYSRR